MKQLVITGIIMACMAACNPNTDNAGDNNRSKMNNNSTEGIENNGYTSDTNGNTLDTDTTNSVQ